MGKTPKQPDFEVDEEALYVQLYPIFICNVCTHNKTCPITWSCETLENLDNDYSSYGDDEA